MTMSINVHNVIVSEKHSIYGIRDAYGKHNNLKFLGSGCYARVYGAKKRKSHYDPDIVYKVGGEPEVDWRDDAYLAYIKKVVLPNQGNPFVPVVHAVDVFRLHDGTTSDKAFKGYFYVIRMEKLIEYDRFGYDTRRTMLKRAGLESIYDFNVRWLDRKIKNKMFNELIPKLKRLFKEHCSDIHDGNVMWRKIGEGNYHIVLTDPAV